VSGGGDKRGIYLSYFRSDKDEQFIYIFGAIFCCKLAREHSVAH